MVNSLEPEKIGKSQRSIKNFLLMPFLQVRFGIYYVVLSIFFAIVGAFILYKNLGKFAEVVLELTGVKDEVKDLLSEYIFPANIQIALLVGIYVIVSIVLGVKLTHSLVGPTVAFRRHIKMIREGNFEYRTKLRAGDAFDNVAEDLNSLSDSLSKSANTKKLI
jgi:methyl-accepting chemotaxis protein